MKVENKLALGIITLSLCIWTLTIIGAEG